MDGEMGWRQVHDRLRQLAASKAKYDLEEMRWLQRARRAQVHRRLGYGSFQEYVERMFGYTARFTYERLKVADALDALPQLAEALGDNRLSYSAVRELTRVATAETVAEWIEAAEGRSLREVEKMVSGRAPGDRPDSEQKRELERHRLVFDVSGETKATLAQARDRLTKELGRSLSDDELLQLLARGVLEGGGEPADARRSPNRIHYEVCPRCDEGAQVVAGEAVPVDAATVARAKCDAVVTGARVGNRDTHVGNRIGHVGTANAPVGDSTSHVASVNTHVGNSTGHVGSGNGRARQSPSPAQREAKMRAQRFGCAVPGCGNRVWLEDHHEDLCSEGGTHDPRRRVALCWAHHDARHRGQLLLEGDTERGWRFFHADGTPYGRPPDPARAEVFRIATDVLRKMGFKDREARPAVAAARAHVGNRPTVEAVVSAALRAIPDPPGARRYPPPPRSQQQSAVRERAAAYGPIPMLRRAA